MKRMLINATQPEELRVAIVDGQKLFNLDIEVPGREQKKANIYKGRITRVEPSLEAAFVDYGSERHGFLPLKEISRNYFAEGAKQSPGRVNIQDAVKEGQEIIVQVEKEERGNKGAALTTFISLAGRYLVLMPNNPRAGGVSRRIEGQDRTELREAMSQLTIPDDMGLIVRTAGVGKNAEELQWDLNYLIQLWQAIETSAEKSAPFLIYQESNVIIRSIRDYLRSDIGEIVIDDPEIFSQASRFISQVMPQYSKKLREYKDEVPLFSRYQIESQIESAFQREVRLPSGGAIVIDHTEALTSIDINSSRATKGADIEETALNTNLEAADEIARQLRLRDLGGLFVIDFIDMTPSRNQREVENRLKDALRQDRARVQVGRISRFGLLEMSRQRLRPSLGEASELVCPRCNGHGTVRGVESLALSVLRIIEEEAMKENTGRIVAQLPVDVATFLLNEKRQGIHDIEQRQSIGVILIPNTRLETPNYSLERVRASDLQAAKGETNLSYQIKPEEVDETPDFARTEQPKSERPAVKSIQPASPAPVRTPTQEIKPEPHHESGFLKKIFTSIFSHRTHDEPEEPKIEAREEPKQQERRQKPRPAQARQQSQDRRKSPSGGRRGGGRPQTSRKDERDKQAKPQQQRRPPQKKRAVKEADREAAKKPEVPQEARSPESEADDGAKPKSTRSGARRGRRGGRRRKPGTGERSQETQEASQQSAKESSGPAASAGSTEQRQKPEKPTSDQTASAKPAEPSQPPAPAEKPAAMKPGTENAGEATAKDRSESSIKPQKDKRDTTDTQSKTEVVTGDKQARSAETETKQPERVNKPESAAKLEAQGETVTAKQPAVEPAKPKPAAKPQVKPAKSDETLSGSASPTAVESADGQKPASPRAVKPKQSEPAASADVPPQQSETKAKVQEPSTAKPSEPEPAPAKRQLQQIETKKPATATDTPPSAKQATGEAVGKGPKPDAVEPSKPKAPPRKKAVKKAKKAATEPTGTEGQAKQVETKSEPVIQTAEAAKSSTGTEKTAAQHPATTESDTHE
ncbi:MAG: ribonuclease E [Gammaproteobacteria bacterium]|nr:ribonuclease E [Gammaproteobacteria bacterium]